MLWKSEEISPQSLSIILDRPENGLPCCVSLRFPMVLSIVLITGMGSQEAGPSKRYVADLFNPQLVNSDPAYPPLLSLFAGSSCCIFIYQRSQRLWIFWWDEPHPFPSFPWELTLASWDKCGPILKVHRGTSEPHGIEPGEGKFLYLLYPLFKEVGLEFLGSHTEDWRRPLISYGPSLAFSLPFYLLPGKYYISFKELLVFMGITQCQQWV